jgi:hypothetical protein
MRITFSHSYVFTFKLGLPWSILLDPGCEVP